MQALLILATLAFPIEMLAPDYRLVLYGLIGLVLIGALLARLVSRRIWQFVLLGALLVAGPLLLPLLPPLEAVLWPRIILTPSLVFLVGRALYQRLTQDRERPLGSLINQALVVLYLLALNLLAVRFDLNRLSQAYFYVGIIYLMLALLRWHRLSLLMQMERFARMPTQPAGRIRRINRFLFLGYALVMLLILVLAPWLRIHDLLPLLGQGLLAALRWFFSLFPSGEPTPTEPAPEPTPEPSGSDPGLPFDPVETARWLVILQEIFFWVFTIAVAGAILFLVGLLLYKLYRRFYDTGQPETDETESLLPRLQEQVREKLRQNRNRFALQFGRDPGQRIRRCFYRLVAGQIRRGLKVQASLTVRQIAAGLDSDRYPVLLEMTALYEKARYGPSCTAEDADQMNRWYKSVHRLDLRRRPADDKER